MVHSGSDEQVRLNLYFSPFNSAIMLLFTITRTDMALYILRVGCTPLDGDAQPVEQAPRLFILSARFQWRAFPPTEIPPK